MKRIQKIIITLFLCLVMAFPLFGCSPKEPAYAVDTVGLAQEEVFAVYKNIYDTPSSYVGKTFRSVGTYETATIEGDDKLYELIAVSNGKSHESGEEMELAFEFTMAEGKTHLNATKGQRIQICGILAAEYEDGTTSLDGDEMVANGKKIVNVFVSATSFAIMLNQPEGIGDDHDH